MWDTMGCVPSSAVGSEQLLPARLLQRASDVPILRTLPVRGSVIRRTQSAHIRNPLRDPRDKLLLSRRRQTCVRNRSVPIRARQFSRSIGSQRPCLDSYDRSSAGPSIQNSDCRKRRRQHTNDHGWHRATTRGDRFGVPPCAIQDKLRHKIPNIHQVVEGSHRIDTRSRQDLEKRSMGAVMVVAVA